MNLDEYVKSAPSPRNAVDIFKGEWSSLLPPPVTGGAIPLFTDVKVGMGGGSRNNAQSVPTPS